MLLMCTKFGFVALIPFGLSFSLLCKSYRTQLSEMLKSCLVHCNDYYMRIGINITKNTLGWNVIWVMLHLQIILQHFYK